MDGNAISQRRETRGTFLSVPIMLALPGASPIVSMYRRMTGPLPETDPVSTNPDPFRVPDEY